MGYEVYVTRGKRWWDEVKTEISLAEWRRCVAADPKLKLDESMGDGFAVWSGPSEHESPWIAWSAGNLHSKNPDAALLEKMLGIAATLKAKVQGEEGEVYLAGGKVKKYSPGLAERTRTWFANVFAKAPEPLDASEIPFKVGDKVRDHAGRVATVEVIDLRAEHGLGSISVRYDDGHVASFMAVAHGFEPLTDR